MSRPDPLTQDQELALIEYARPKLGRVTYAEMLTGFVEESGIEPSLYQLIRVIREWKESGGYEDWLFSRWFYLFKKMEEDEPKEAFRAVTRLLEKLFVKKYKHQIDGQVNFEASKEFMNFLRVGFAQKPNEPPKSGT